MSQTSTAWTFGKNPLPHQKIRTGAVMQAPGPGAYTISGKGIVTASQPAYTVGRGSREGATGPVKAMARFPGPGQYEQDNDFRNKGVAMG